MQDAEKWTYSFGCHRGTKYCHSYGNRRETPPSLSWPQSSGLGLSLGVHTLRSQPFTLPDTQMGRKVRPDTGSWASPSTSSPTLCLLCFPCGSHHQAPCSPDFLWGSVLARDWELTCFLSPVPRSHLHTSLLADLTFSVALTSVGRLFLHDSEAPNTLLPPCPPGGFLN